MSELREPAPSCECARRFRVEQGKSAEYARFKTLLNRCRHPSYIGPEFYARCARNGGCFFATLDGVDLAVALINPRRGVFNVLSVLPAHRAHGLGSALVHWCRAPLIRSTQQAATFAERFGYSRVAAVQTGRVLEVQMLVDSNVRGLAGRIATVLRDRIAVAPADPIHTSAARPQPAPGPAPRAKRDPRK